jgi:processing peptidase subunit alpha
MMHILRTLLGNASAFSSGGPGKGMHSRCTKNLLNRVACVEKTSSITEHYSDSGIFGLTVGGPFDMAKDVVECTVKEFNNLLVLIEE